MSEQIAMLALNVAAGIVVIIGLVVRKKLGLPIEDDATPEEVDKAAVALDAERTGVAITPTQLGRIVADLRRELDEALMEQERRLRQEMAERDQRHAAELQVILADLSTAIDYATRLREDFLRNGLVPADWPTGLRRAYSRPTPPVSHD